MSLTRYLETEDFDSSRRLMKILANLRSGETAVVKIRRNNVIKQYKVTPLKKVGNVLKKTTA